jgi:hypothetical protein
MPSEGARKRLQGLIDLAWRSMPRVESGSGQFDDWTTYARGTVARCAYLSESVLALADRPLDGEVVARSLFEHVITFAWIAAEPTSRLARWIAKDLRNRETLAREASTRFGLADLPEEVKAFFREERDGVEEPPNVPEMARQADAHWLAVFNDIFRSTSSLSGLYTIGYRGYSASVHPTVAGISPFYGRARGSGIVVGRPVFDPRRCPFGECTNAMTALLLITGHALGWPEPKMVSALWDAEPARAD